LETVPKVTDDLDSVEIEQLKAALARERAITRMALTAEPRQPQQGYARKSPSRPEPFGRSRG
jgi:hypothetical protein